MVVIPTLLFASTAIILFWFYLKQRWKVLQGWGIPHDPPSIGRLGHQLDIFGNKTSAEYFLQSKAKFGKVWGYYELTKPRIVIHDPSMIRQVMTTNFLNDGFSIRFPESMLPVEDVFPSGLVFANGKQWRRMRSTISPAFTPSKIKDMIPMMNRCVDNTMKIIAKKGKGELDVHDIFARLTLDIMCATAFGSEINSPSAEASATLLSQTVNVFDNEQIGAIPILLNMAFPSLRRYICRIFMKRRQKCIQYLTKFCEMIAKRRRESFSNPIDLFQVMLDSRMDDFTAEPSRGLTDYEIAANSLTMLTAGRSTASISMLYFSYNLAMHPQVQTKLQREIDKFYQSTDDPDWTNVRQIKYLEMCILESLRLYCPFSRIPRQANRDIVVGNFVIPKGVSVDIPIHAIQRDPEFWVNPLEFDPERFRDAADLDTMMYQVFGSGPRICIGKRLALIEMQLFFTRFLLEYTVLPSSSTPQPPLPVIFGVSTTPENPVTLRFVSRSR